MYLRVLFIFTIFISSHSYSGVFGPSNYDECILDSMKGVTSDVAARLVARSCREEFPIKPKKTPKTSPLNYQQLSKVTGRAGGNGYFSGSLYNGNEDITVTEVTIQITTKISGKEVSNLYTDAVIINPQTTSSFSFGTIAGDKDAEQSWYIKSAQGYRP